MRTRRVILLLVVVCGSFAGYGCDPGLPTRAVPAPNPVTFAPSPGPSAPPPTLAIPLPPGAPPSVTRLIFTSDPGDYVGQGLTRTYYLGDGTWNPRYDETHRGIITIYVSNVQVPDYWNWAMYFAAPLGQPLRVGTYEATHLSGTSFYVDERPGMDFSGTGRGCDDVSGRFTVTAIRIGPVNNVESFAATFEQHCEGAAAALRGEVVIAADPWR